MGTGKTLFLFCDQFEESLGIDVSEGMLTTAKSNVQEFLNKHSNDDKKMSIDIKKMGV